MNKTRSPIVTYADVGGVRKSDGDTVDGIVLSEVNCPPWLYGLPGA